MTMSGVDEVLSECIVDNEHGYNKEPNASDLRKAKPSSAWSVLSVYVGTTNHSVFSTPLLILV